MAPIATSELRPSSPEDRTSILIVGTGLAGLTAALECHRKGMDVRILERNAALNDSGDMIFLECNEVVQALARDAARIRRNQSS